MLNGVLNPHEPHSLGVVRNIVTRLIGKAATEGQKLFFSVPAPPIDGEDGISYHEASIGQMLADLGYAPTSIEEGLAVVFGELDGSNYSGIGISCGSGLSNVCLAELSVPHPDLAANVTRIDITRYGHAMAIPVPRNVDKSGLKPLYSLGNKLSKQYEPTLTHERLNFAHSDWAGYSIFEEAFTQGHWAA